MNIQNMKITNIRPYEKNPRLNEGAGDAVAASLSMERQRTSQTWRQSSV